MPDLAKREELVDRLLQVEHEYAQLHARWLSLNDHVLEWQLKAEQAERRLEQRQQVPADVQRSLDNHDRGETP